MQTIVYTNRNYAALDTFLKESGIKSLFIVHDSSYPYLAVSKYLDNLPAQGIEVFHFSDFTPNPQYESVVEGVKQFCARPCDAILAVGGGSAMDVAKCIKLYATMDHTYSYLAQELKDNSIRLLALPTTAGTGSEATRYAVIYANGEKQSVTHDSCIPSVAIFDASVLDTLPIYQKKATLLDTMAHSIESIWARHATEESVAYAKEAIGLVLANKEAYLAGDKTTHTAMLKAANLAGKAINITATTAGHAMSYKLTSLYGIPHGHAAGLVLTELVPYTAARASESKAVRAAITTIAEAFGTTAEKLGEAYNALFASLSMPKAPKASEHELSILINSVNMERLSNYPLPLSKEEGLALYRAFLQG